MIINKKSGVLEFQASAVISGIWRGVEEEMKGQAGHQDILLPGKTVHRQLHCRYEWPGCGRLYGGDR